MKKITLILCAALLVLAACVNQNDNANKYVINGHLSDADYDGEMIYLLDAFDGTELDSTKIENGLFTFTDTVGTPMFVFVSTDREFENHRLLLVLEPGEIYVDMMTDSLSGTALNDKLHEFDKYSEVIGEEIQSLSFEARMMMNEEDQGDEVEELEKRYEILMEEYNQTIKQYYNENKSNFLGVFFLLNMGELTFEEMDSMLQGAAPEVVNHPAIQEKYESLKQGEATKEGNHYVDIDVLDFQTGKMAKLSDYVDGKIALVDFWASWCRPCRAEIPHIASIYKKYGNKIVVISLNVWDDPDAQAAAIQEMKMNWIQLTDPTENNATKTYGVDGIPQILLIGADGTILARDLREESIEDAIVNALK